MHWLLAAIIKLSGCTSGTDHEQRQWHFFSSEVPTALRLTTGTPMSAFTILTANQMDSNQIIVSTGC
jgi:hypothetical protein